MKKLKILIAEDNPDHAELAVDAIESELPDSEIIVVNNGEEVLSFFQNTPKEKFPDLCILDLKMPRVSGFDVLRVMRSDASLNEIPIIVLTTSTYESDITVAKELEVDSYLLKPVDRAELRRKLSSLNWKSCQCAQEETGDNYDP